MELFEEVENKADIHLMDFPFICRICLRRGDLRLFEQEDYLLFVTITKIDVRSTVNFPSNICDQCMNELEDISLFIDSSKYNDSRLGKNMIPKTENEYVAKVDSGTSQEPVVKVEKTTEEYEDDKCTEKSEMCPICLVPSRLTPFEEKPHLMQLFQNITNIDLEAASNSSSRNGICEKCISKLESISLFISVSLSNNIKIESTFGRNESMKTENCWEGNAIDISLSKSNDIKFDNISGRKEVDSRNYSNESLCSYDSKDFHTVIDIKEEILHVPEAPVRQNDQQVLEFCSDSNYVEKLGWSPCRNEVSTENHPNIIPKGLNGSLKALFQTERFTCDCCEKSFASKDTLKRHMLTHTGEKPFICDKCGKSFNQKSNLKVHMLTHTGEKPFKCDSCGKSFNNKRNLKIHMVTHIGEKPFKCEKSYSQNMRLTKHMLNHTREKPFQCDRSSLQGYLIQHTMLVHTGENPFKCDICQKGFTRKDSLIQHMLVHPAEKPFKCDICQNGFSYKDTLKRHMIIHSAEKPFKCVRCEKGFNEKASLTTHMLNHTGEKPFQCDVCQKCFSQKKYLRPHMILHTGEKYSNVTSAKKVSVGKVA